MDQQTIIKQTVDYIRAEFSGEGTGHDWWHIYRVWQMAQRIGAAEGAELFVVELAALLHDIADWKFHDGDDDAGPAAAGAWLAPFEIDPAVVAEVKAIIAGTSFKGEGEAPAQLTLAGQVVQDADRLDAIGAIGIARAFAFGGWKGNPLHDPDIPVHHNMTAAAYKLSNGTTINHFYEKLLLLKDRMNTATGRQMAEARHQVMLDFLAQFDAEWHGSQ